MNAPLYARTMPVTVFTSYWLVAARTRLICLLICARFHGIADVLPPFMYGDATTIATWSRSIVSSMRPM